MLWFWWVWQPTYSEIVRSERILSKEVRYDKYRTSLDVYRFLKESVSLKC